MTSHHDDEPQSHSPYDSPESSPYDAPRSSAFESPAYGDTRGEVPLRPFVDTTALTRNIQLMLGLEVLSYIVTFFVVLALRSTIEGGPVRFFSSEQDAIGVLDAVGNASILLSLVRGICVLVWIYRSNYNARALGAKGMRFTPGWAVGWHLIPFANFVMPFPVTKELWQASHNPRDWQNQQVSPLVPLWFAQWLALMVLSFVQSAMAELADSRDDQMFLSSLLLAMAAIGTTVTVSYGCVLGAIHRAQHSHVEPVPEDEAGEAYRDDTYRDDTNNEGLIG